MVGREKTVQEFLHFPYNLLFSLHPSSVKQLCCACYLLFISSFVCQGVRRQILTSVMREFVLTFLITGQGKVLFPLACSTGHSIFFSFLLFTFVSFSHCFPSSLHWKFLLVFLFFTILHITSFPSSNDGKYDYFQNTNLCERFFSLSSEKKKWES